MGKRKRVKEKIQEESVRKQKKDFKDNPLSLRWQKIVIFLLALIPFIYFLQFFSPSVMIAGSDYVTERFALEKWTSSQNQFPLWVPHIYGGVPVFASPIGIPLAPLTWLIYLMPPQVVLAIKFFVFMFLAGLGMYLYAKEIGLSKYSAALGAFIFQFIGNLATTPYAGHAARAAGVALIPLLLFFAHRALNTRKFSHWILLSLFFALYFYEGQFQVNYYGMLFILAYVVYRLIARRRDYDRTALVKTIAFGIISVILFMMLMAVVWLTVYGGLNVVARGIQRGYEYSSSWAMPPIELLDLIVPSFSGILEKYWGSNPFKLHTEYFGLLAVMLGIFAIVRFWKKEYVRFFSIAFAITTLVAIGRATPLFRIFYLVVPAFKMFRAPSLVFYLSSFSFIVLACIAFEYLVVKGLLEAKKSLITSIVITSSLIIVVLITVTIGPDLAGDKFAAYENNSGALTMGIFLAVVLGALGIAVIMLGIKRSLHPATVTGLMVILSLLSQVPLMARYLPKMLGPEKEFAADPVVQILKKDTGLYRTLPLNYDGHAGDNYLFYHAIQSAGGASPNPLQRYQEYIGAGTSVMFNPASLIQYPRLGDMLNVKYIIISQLDQRVTAALRPYLNRFSIVFNNARYTVYQNDSVLPRAYLVTDYAVAQAPSALNLLKSGGIDARTTVLLEDDPGIPHPSAPAAFMEIRVTHYSANAVACSTDSPLDGFLVLADNWHPDWQVYIDGQKEKLYRANYTFRAVHVPAGKHAIKFAYESRYFAVGTVITLIGMVLIIAIFFPRAMWWLVTKAAPLINKPPAANR